MKFLWAVSILPAADSDQSALSWHSESSSRANSDSDSERGYWKSKKTSQLKIFGQKQYRGFLHLTFALDSCMEMTCATWTALNRPCYIMDVVQLRNPGTK